jgi:glycosyltransferase involved in cell wall biosynthesis
MSHFKRMRILYVNHTGHVSGSERVLIDTLRVLDRERYEPVVMCPMHGGLAEEILATRVECLPLPSFRARFAMHPGQIVRSLFPVFKAAQALRRQIRVLAPGLIHANSVRAGLLATLAAAGTGTPVIWHVHDTLPKHSVSTLLRLFVLTARNTRAIGVSTATTQRFCGGVPIAGRVRTIHNGIDLSRFAPNPAGSRAFREELGLSSDSFLVCAVGQICERKGLLELIDALRRIRAKVPQMHLAIVGRVVFRHEEGYLEALRVAVKSWGVEDLVHFCGERKDVSAVLHASDLAVLNSRDEPFGLVLVEAMACGAPVLAARIGGIPEIVTDGENGWLVEPGDTEALASKLLHLLSSRDELRRAAEQAQRVTCPRFSIDRYQSELMALYDELVPQRNGRWSHEATPAFAKSGNQ